VVALLDAAHLVGQDAPRAETVPAALLLLVLLPALGLLAGTAAGWLARLVAVPARSRPLRGSAARTFSCLVAGLSVVPLTFWVHSVFAGPRVSRVPGRAALEVLVVAVLALLLAVAVRRLLALPGAPRAVRLRAAAGALLGAAFLHWADGHLYVRTYGQIHAALALAAAALASVAAGALGLHRRFPRPRTALLYALLLAGASAGVLARADRLRWTVRGRAPAGGKIVALSDPFFDAGPGPAAPELLAEVLPPPDPAWDGRRPALDRRFPGRRAAGVVLVTVDTLRPDRMGLYGHPRGATPHLDALGRESVHFPETRAQYPGTRFSMSSMLRSRHPACTPEFHADLLATVLDDPPPMLAERLKGLGFRTALFVDLNDVDLANPGRFGFFRLGMDRIHNVPEPSSPELARAAVEHLAAIGAERTFTWVHFNDPHGPYRSVPEFPFGSSEEDRYLSEVAAADAAIGLLVGGLSKAGLLDRLVVVVHSDHGEEFGEHGGRTHLTTTYEEQVRVPLLLRVPGIDGGPAAAPAALIDVVPTLIELLDLPRDPGVHGRSLVPQLLDRNLGLDRLVFSQVDHLVTTGDRVRAVVRGPWKLILDLGSGSRELYDLSRDPREQENLAGSGRPVEEELVRRIAAFVSVRCSGRTAEAEAELERLTARYAELPPPERDHARALAGQVSDEAARRLFREALARGTPQEIVEAAGWLLPQGDAEALAILLSLLRAPAPETRRTAAIVLGLHRKPEARAPLQGLVRDPDPLVRAAAAFSRTALGERVDPEALRPMLAHADPLYPFLGRLGLALHGEDDTGVLLVETLLRRVPQLNQIVLDHLERSPRPELLRALMAVQMDLYQPTDVRTNAVRAIGRLEHPDALRALARVERSPSREVAQSARASLEARMGADAAELERLRRGAALSLEADALLMEGAPDRAAQVLRDAVRADPGDAQARLALARTLWNGGDEDGARRELEAAALHAESVLPAPRAAAHLLRALAPGDGSGSARPTIESVELEGACFSGDPAFVVLRIRNGAAVPRAGPLWRKGLAFHWRLRDADGTATDGGFDYFPRGHPDVLAPGETTLFEARFWPPRRPGVHELRIGIDGAGEEAAAMPLLVLAPEGANLREALRRQALDLEVEGRPVRCRAGAEVAVAVRVAYRGSLRLPGGDRAGSLSLTPVSRRTGKQLGPPIGFPVPVIGAGARVEAEARLQAPAEAGAHDLDLVPAIAGYGTFDAIPWTRIEIDP
jgi:arylsulfatase A-like enzyme/HEAT repeat protein